MLARRLIVLLAFCFCLSGAAGEPVPSALLPSKLSPDLVRDALGMARGLFDVGQYDRAGEYYAALLDHPDFALLPEPPVEDPVERERLREARRVRFRRREEALFFLARIGLEQTKGDPEALRLEVGKLLNLAARQPPVGLKSALADDARYWCAEALLDAGLANEAVGALEGMRGLAARPELDVQVAWVLAQSLLQRREDGDRQRAASELSRIVVAYGERPVARAAVLELMALRLETEEYEKADELAAAYLDQAPADDPGRARALLVRGRVAFLAGRLEDAIRAYEQARDLTEASAGDRLEARYRLGWCYAATARTGSARRREQLLRDARRAFRDVLRDLEKSDDRWQPASYGQGLVLVEGGQYEEAVESLTPLLGHPELGVEAAYHLAVALQGLRRYDEALAQLQRVIGEASTGRTALLLQRAHQALADLEMARGQFVLAREHYVQAKDLAIGLRDEPAEAECLMGMVRCEVQLGLRDRAQSEDAPLPEAQAAPVDHHAAALQLMKLLQNAHPSRVRTDELLYLRGLVRLRSASESRDRALAQAWTESDRVREAVDLYDLAEEDFRAGLSINDQGEFTPMCRHRLGLLHVERGRFSHELATRYASMGRLRDEEACRQEGNKRFEWSKEQLRQVVQEARSGDLRRQARQALADVHLALEEYRQAAEILAALAHDPDAPMDERARSALRWAESLVRAGDRNRALQALRPFLHQSVEVAIRAGRLLEEMQRPPEAYAAYRAGYPSLRQAERETPTLAAELLFRLHALALARPEVLSESGQPAAVRQDAERGLENVVEKFPQTSWASRALLLLARERLAQRHLQKVRSMAEAVQAIPEAPKLLLQTAALVAGQASVAAGDFDAADAAFARAAELNPLQATATEALEVAVEALLERAKLAQRQADVDRAIAFLGSAAGEFGAAGNADLARVAAVKLLVARGRPDDLVQAERLTEAVRDAVLRDQAAASLSAPSAAE